MFLHILRPDAALALSVAYRALCEVLGAEPTYHDEVKVERPSLGRATFIVSCLNLTGQDTQHHYTTSIQVLIENLDAGPHVVDIHVLIQHKDGSEPSGLASGFGKNTLFVTSMPSDDTPDARFLPLYGIPTPRAA